MPTLTGRVALKIPPETEDGRVFRLRGQGVPLSENPKERGSLIAEAHVEIPRNLTESERTLIRELAAARGEKVGAR